MNSATNGWQETKIGDVLTLEYGKGLPERKRREGPFPVFGSGGLSGFHEEFLIEGPGIVVGRKGSIGTVYYETRDFFPIDTVFYVNPASNDYDLRFLYYFLKQAELARLGSDAAVPGLNRNTAHAQDCRIPPLPTQRKIAGVLSAYDDLIENNARRIAILEEMAASLYREWFVERRFPGHEAAPMVEGAPGQLPQGWKMQTLGDLARDERRAANPAQVDADTPYIGLEHIPRKSIALSEWGCAADVSSAKLFFHEGEILFGKIRPYFHKVAVAPVSGVCSTDAIVIVPRAAEFFALVLCCASSDEFVAHAVQTSQGTKMPRANWGVMSRFPVAVPPPALLQRFSETVGEMVEQIGKLTFANRNLRATRDLLLPKLVSGEVDVSQLAIAGADDDVDEEANGAEDAS